MGALSGSLSYLRFFVDGDVAPNPGTLYEKSIGSRRFMPLSPSKDEDEAAGWVSTFTPYDEAAELTRGDFLLDSLLVLTYREDVYAISRPQIARATRQRLLEIAKEKKEDIRDFSRAFTKAVEKSVVSELRHKILPRTKLVDVVWDFEKKEVRVFGRGNIVSERIASLFERTFHVRLTPASFAARAFQADLSGRAQAVLDRLSPGWLFPQAGQVTPQDDGGADDDERVDADAGKADAGKSGSNHARG